MKKLMILAAILLGAGSSFAQNQLGEVIGEVKTQNGIDAGSFHVFIDDAFGQRYQAKTDVDGRFRISAIPAGTYMLNIRKSEDTLKVTDIKVPVDGFFDLGLIEFGLGDFAINTTEKPDIIVKPRFKMIDGNLPVKELTAEELQGRPDKFDVKSMISSMSSDIQLTADNEIVIRGARPGDLLYLIDGVKADEIGSMPSAGIGRIQVYTGGIPAKYGDTLGGVVVMETQGYFDLYRAWKAEQLKAGN